MSKETKKKAEAKKPTQAAAPKKAAAKPAAPAASAKKPAAVRAKAAPPKSAGKAVAANAAVPAQPGAKPPARPAPGKAARRRTVISAHADIGFGNQLFIRGEGAGLSWDRGIPMECKAADQWEWSTETSDGPIAFKVLINDQLWSHGENLEAEPGATRTVRPDF